MVSKKEVIEGGIEIEGTFLELVRERPSGEFKNFRSVLVFMNISLSIIQCNNIY